MFPILTLLLIVGSPAFAQRAKPTPQAETGYVNCQWRFLGFYLDMPEPDALKRIPALQLFNEGYEHSYTAQVTFEISMPKYSQVSKITLQFRRGRILAIDASLSSQFVNHHINDLVAWVMKQYALPDEWETSSAVEDVADNGVLRGARSLESKGAHFYVSNVDRHPYVSISYR
jgi:hypothetical protein